MLIDPPKAVIQTGIAEIHPENQNNQNLRPEK
jgi:hypothetical protein